MYIHFQILGIFHPQFLRQANDLITRSMCIDWSMTSGWTQFASTLWYMVWKWEHSAYWWVFLLSLNSSIHLFENWDDKIVVPKERSMCFIWFNSSLLHICLWIWRLDVGNWPRSNLESYPRNSLECQSGNFYIIECYNKQ